MGEKANDDRGTDVTRRDLAVLDFEMRRRKPRPDQRTAEEYPWMQPAKVLRDGPEYRQRRISIIQAMVERHCGHTGRPFATGDWRNFVAELIGPTPEADNDAAGNPRNPEWWLHYVLSTDADQIRQQGMRVMKGAPLVYP